MHTKRIRIFGQIHYRLTMSLLRLIMFIFTFDLLYDIMTVTIRNEVFI